MAASIKEVARLAGVSVATVSHVTNGTRFVSESTRGKVLAAINELQYTPNSLARAFKTGSRDTVGFVVPDIANGYFATLIEEVEDVLQTHGLRLIVSNTREDRFREIDGLRMLSSGVVDGLLLASTLVDFREIAEALPPRFPVVLIDRAVSGATVDTIATDNATAVREGVSALIRRGHRRIGFMASVRHLNTTTERVCAYREALEEHKLAVDEQLIRYLEKLTEPVRPSAEALLELDCTAIVASNNVLTNKLAAEFDDETWARRGVEILGYRDPARHRNLHTMAEWLEEPIGEMGRLAGEAIVRRLSEPESEPRTTVLHAVYSASVSVEGPPR